MQEQAAKLAWPDPPVRISFDRHLGYGGAAALPAATGLAAMMVAKGKAPDWCGGGEPREVVVSSCVPDEGVMALRLLSPEVEACDA